MEACRTTGLVSLFLLLFWLLIPGHIHGQQTSEQEKYHVDSTLFVYYQHCKAEIKSPSVMQMLDTLFLMAKEKGDLRMQAVAISSKTDHFYFGPSFEGQEDSLILYTNAIKDFARKTNQPQYYYFAWANRLITYYTKQKILRKKVPILGHRPQRVIGYPIIALSSRLLRGSSLISLRTRLPKMHE